MNRSLSKRSSFVFIILLVAVLLGIYFAFRPRLAPGQAPLTDIQNIETRPCAHSSIRMQDKRV